MLHDCLLGLRVIKPGRLQVPQQHAIVLLVLFGKLQVILAAVFDEFVPLGLFFLSKGQISEYHSLRQAF